MITVTLLGTAATMPLPDRSLTAVLLSFEGRSILFDCGEGTQAAACKGKYDCSGLDRCDLLFEQDSRQEHDDGRCRVKQDRSC